MMNAETTNKEAQAMKAKTTYGKTVEVVSITDRIATVIDGCNIRQIHTTKLFRNGVAIK